MRGATKDECRRVAAIGDILRVECRNMQTQYPGHTEIVYALSDDKNRSLIFAALGTRLRIINVSRAVGPEQVKVIFGDQAVGTELMAWNYPEDRGDQFIGDPPVLCLCFLRSVPWTVIHLCDLAGVKVEIIADPPPTNLWPTAKVKRQALAPVL